MTIEGTIELAYVVFKEDVKDFTAFLRGSYRNLEDHIDGIVRYEGEYTRDPVLEDEKGVQGPFTVDYFQPFVRGGHKKVDGRNVWGWDGDKEKPTLHPSFGHGKQEDGWAVHLFLRNGRIDPCDDMVLEVKR